MPNPASIRLGTTGKAQVKADFGEIAESGTASFQRIGDVGDAQAKRWSRSYDNATRDVEAAIQRQQSAAAKIAAIMPQTATQMRINDANGTGFGQYEGSARQSAAAFLELEAAQQKVEARARALVAAIDPAFAAQHRFNREIGEARALVSAGAISLDQYVAKLRMEQDALDAVGGTAKKSGNAFAAAAPQIQDLFVQISMGGNPLNALVVQGGQLAGQLQYAGGKAEAFANILMGPWGVAAQVALLVLSPFVAKLFEGNNAFDEAVEKLRKDAQETGLTDRAKYAFGNTLAGVTEAIRDQKKALNDLADADKSAAERSYEAAKAQLQKALAVRVATAAMAEQAAREASAANQTTFGAAGGAGAAQAQVLYSREAAEASRIAKEAVAAVAEAQKLVEGTRFNLDVETAQRMADPVQAINKRYADRIAIIREADQALIAAGNHARADSAARITELEKQKAAAVERYQAEQRAAGQTANQIGRNVSIAEARSIAEGIGGKVTSDVRSRSEQQRLYDKYVAYKNGGPWAALAAKPGTSNHERGQALDIEKSGGVTLAKIIAAYRQAGVKLSEALDEGSHYHIAFRKTGEAARAATEERQEAAKKVRDAAAAERELESDLRSVVAAYDPARAAADEYAATLAKIDALVKGGKLTIDAAAGIRMTAYHAEQKRMADAGFETFKKLFGTDDPMAEAIEGARRGISQRVEEMADEDAAKVRVVTTALDELRGYGADFVTTVLSEDTWSSWGNAGKTILNSLKNEFITLALLNPLKNLINGDEALPTLSTAVANIGKLFKPGANAAGTEYWSGGMSLVGENGPEFVSIGRGARIAPAAETRRMLAGNDNAPRSENHYHFTGNMMTPEFWAMVQQGDAQAAMQGAAGGAQIGQAEAQRAGARRLGRFR